MNIPLLNDRDYDYFRTAEEKKAALPKTLNDQFWNGTEWQNCWVTDGFDTGSTTYRRHKPPSPQHPRWVKCSEISVGVPYYLPRADNSICHVDLHCGHWRWTEANCLVHPQPTHVYDISPIPTPPKVEEKKDEFIMGKPYRKYIAEQFPHTIGHIPLNEFFDRVDAALASKESKKDAE